MRLCETRCKSIRLYAMAFVAFVFLLQGRLTEGSVYGRAAVELSEGIEKEQPGVATFPYQVTQRPHTQHTHNTHTHATHTEHAQHTHTPNTHNARKTHT